MTPTTKTDSPAVVDDLRPLRTLRALRDAPARERAAAEVRELDAEQRQRQDAALSYARGIVVALEDAVAATTAWDTTPVDATVFRAMFGETVPVWRASDQVNDGRHLIVAAARAAAAAAQLVPELAGPTVLPTGRLTTIETVLDDAAGQAEGFTGVYAAWTRVREDSVALLPAVRGLLDALERRWTPTAAERALLARQQEKLASAAAAMPPLPPPTPRRGIPGAILDIVQRATSRPPKLLENRFED